MEIRKHTLICSFTLVIILDFMKLTDCASLSRTEKRFPNPLQAYAMKSMAPDAHSKYLSLLHQKLEKLRTRERRTHHLSDVGYGSRVAAGSNMAVAHMARHDIFGIHGPGRRKRDLLY